MAAAGHVRRIVLAAACLVVIGAGVGLLAPGLRGGARQATRVAPTTVPVRTTVPVPTTVLVPTTLLVPTTVLAPTTVPAAVTHRAATTLQAATSGVGTDRSTLASTGLSPWWWLGGGGLAYLGVVVAWSELQLRPDPQLARWWGPYRPRHRRGRRRRAPGTQASRSQPSSSGSAGRRT